MNVDKQSSIDSSFVLNCHGVSAKSSKLELVKGRYRPAADLCQGGQIRVAFAQWPGLFEVDTASQKMVKYPLSWSYMYGLAFPNEILTTFFNEHHLSPTFLNNNQQWNGAIIMVRAATNNIDIFIFCY